MRYLFLSGVVICAGCAHRGEPERAAGAEGIRTIAVGQPWSQATGVAAGAGYVLHDAGELAISPKPEGFSIELPGGRGLLVLRDPRGDVVQSIESIANADGPKKLRVYRAVRSFDLPPAGAAAR